MRVCLTAGIHHWGSAARRLGARNAGPATRDAGDRVPQQRIRQRASDRGIPLDENGYFAGREISFQLSARQRQSDPSRTKMLE